MTVSFDNAGSHTTAYWGESCGASTSGGTIVNINPLGTTGNACNPKEDATSWQIQGGITKNWFGMGNTAIYGEYASGHGLGC